MRNKYTVTLNRDVTTTVGHLVIRDLIAGQASETIIAPPTSFTQTAGPRAFSTLRAAKAFQTAQRATHGTDVCGEVVTL